MSRLSSHPEKHCTFCNSINKAVLRWRAMSSHPCGDFTGSNSQQNFWNVVGAAHLPNCVAENGLALDWTFLMLANLILQQIYSSAFVLVTSVQKLVITAMQNGSLRPISGSGCLKLTSLQISWVPPIFAEILPRFFHFMTWFSGLLVRRPQETFLH